MVRSKSISGYGPVNSNDSVFIGVDGRKMWASYRLHETEDQAKEASEE